MLGRVLTALTDLCQSWRVVNVAQRDVACTSTAFWAHKYMSHLYRSHASITAVSAHTLPRGGETSCWRGCMVRVHGRVDGRRRCCWQQFLVVVCVPQRPRLPSTCCRRAPGPCGDSCLSAFVPETQNRTAAAPYTCTPCFSTNMTYQNFMLQPRLMCKSGSGKLP